MNIKSGFRTFWLCFLILTFVGIGLGLAFAHLDFTLNWRTASRESAHIAPLPSAYHDAVVEVYAARVYGWRGVFGVHMWIATKGKNAANYQTYQVIGWRRFYDMSPLVVRRDIPDRFWFGQRPQLIKDLRGQEAEKIIVELQKLVRDYPYDHHYVLWPGPNSNTFIAYIVREIPELKISLPPTAIGKDYLGGAKFWSQAPSKSGYQMAFYGIFGVLLARDEGLEINILGLVFGANPKQQSLILPGIGDIYWSKGMI